MSNIASHDQASSHHAWISVLSRWELFFGWGVIFLCSSLCLPQVTILVIPRVKADVQTFDYSCQTVDLFSLLFLISRIFPEFCVTRVFTPFTASFTLPSLVVHKLASCVRHHWSKFSWHHVPLVISKTKMKKKLSVPIISAVCCLSVIAIHMIKTDWSPNKDIILYNDWGDVKVAKSHRSPLMQQPSCSEQGLFYKNLHHTFYTTKRCFQL